MRKTFCVAILFKGRTLICYFKAIRLSHLQETSNRFIISPNLEAHLKRWKSPYLLGLDQISILTLIDGFNFYNF